MPKFRYSYVNVYLVDKAWGGPEEGGWFYDYGLPEVGQCTLVFSKADAKQAIRKAREWCNVENGERRSDTSSVLSEGRYEVALEPQEAKAWPSTRPYYE